MNGGSIIGVAGENFAVIASDKRLSEGYSILSRNSPHLYQLQPNCVIGSVGFHGDCLTFTKTLEIRLKMFEHEHNKKASTPAVAQLISTMLYNRRFFPYYVNTIVAGLNNEGQGAIYSYDPVGSYEREVYRAAGSSSALLQPLLDSLLGMKNQTPSRLIFSFSSFKRGVVLHSISIVSLKNGHLWLDAIKNELKNRIICKLLKRYLQNR